MKFSILLIIVKYSGSDAQSEEKRHAETPPLSFPDAPSRFYARNERNLCKLCKYGKVCIDVKIFPNNARAQRDVWDF